ncbi:MAG: class F sortase [Mycobacteriales bacterium]
MSAANPTAAWPYVAGLAVGLCLFGLAGYRLVQRLPVTDLGVVPGRWVAAAAPVPVPAAAVSIGDPVPAPIAAAPAAGTDPVRLRIPRLGVDAAVTPVGVLPGGDLDVPADPAVLGWWSGSARPGVADGSVVVDGHVDSARDGAGALFRLRELRPGDAVEVGGDDGQVLRYVVTARRQYAKSGLPAAEVFGPTPGPRLVLITCGGRFDSGRRHYADNVVVYAVPET